MNYTVVDVLQPLKVLYISYFYRLFNVVHMLQPLRHRYMAQIYKKFKSVGSITKGVFDYI